MILKPHNVTEIGLALFFTICLIRKPKVYVGFIVVSLWLAIVIEYSVRVSRIPIPLRMHNYAEFGASVICSACLMYKPSVFNRWFILFLWSTVVVELMGKMLWAHRDIRYEMYNIFSGAEFVFYILFLLNLVKNERLAKSIKLFLVLFILFFVLNFFFLQGMSNYNSDTHTAGSVILIILSVRVFYGLMKDEGVVYKFNQAGLISILSGIFLYYSAIVFLVATLKFIVKLDERQAGLLYQSINQPFNVILYGLFSFGFLLEVLGNPGKQNQIYQK